MHAWMWWVRRRHWRRRNSSCLSRVVARYPAGGVWGVHEENMMNFFKNRWLTRARTVCGVCAGQLIFCGLRALYAPKFPSETLNTIRHWRFALATRCSRMFHCSFSETGFYLRIFTDATSRGHGGDSLPQPARSTRCGGFTPRPRDCRKRLTPSHRRTLPNIHSDTTG